MYSKENSRVDVKYRNDGFYNRYYKKKCAVCDDEFLCYTPLTKYCSQRCKNDALTARRQAKMKERRANAQACIVCGGILTQTDTRIKSYCSLACKQRAYRGRKAEVE
jgi:hypothetical protein